MARLANSLVRLRTEADTLAPSRSRLSDGWIGDPSHQNRCSRHNPNDFGVVCALDLTHDPAGGFDAHGHAEKIRQKPHPELDYIISNGRIAKRSAGFAWRTYLGSNPHTRHVHFGVGVGSDCEPRPPYDDGSTSWGVFVQPAPTPTPPPPEPPTKEQVMAIPVVKEGVSGQYARNCQALLIAHGNTIVVDGIFGPKSAQVLRDWQARTGYLVADGICGPKTWVHLTGVQ